MLEVYKKLRPGEPPTIDSAQQHLDNLFFNEHRYDLSRVGRYKYNKKLAISDRLKGHVAAENIVDPLTGEILVMEGEKISRDKALEVEQAGVSSAFIDADGVKIKLSPTAW